MAESDIQVGSTVRYVGSHRDVRGSEGMVLEVTTWDEVVVDFGSTVRFSHRDDLVHVRPPKPPTEAPALNSYDMVQDPDGTTWTVVRDSDEEVVELHNPLADRCHYALLRVVENWTRVGRFDASTEARFKRSHRCELAVNDYDIATDPELVESLSARVFNVLASSPKVPYTDVGTAIIESTIRAQLKSGSGIGETAIRAAEIRAAGEVAATHLDHLDSVRQLQCRSAALPESRSGPSIADLGTDVTNEYPLLRGSGGPPGEAPPLNTDLRAHYERIVHSCLEERLRTGDTVDAMASKIFSTMLRAASAVNTVWAGSWTDAAESGPGIAALNLQAPPRPRRRRETTSWDPDMPLPDAEPGRYGWLP